MKIRMLAAAALMLGLAAPPAEAGLFGKKKNKELPKPASPIERMGHYEIAPERPKRLHKLNPRSGNEHLRKHHALPIFMSNPWVHER